MAQAGSKRSSMQQAFGSEIGFSDLAHALLHHAEARGTHQEEKIGIAIPFQTPVLAMQS